MKSETPETALRKRIQQERARQQVVTPDEVYQRISSGEIVRAVGNLLFHTGPVGLGKKLEVVLDKVSKAYMRGHIGLQMHILDFLVRLSIGLRSFLPHWIILKELDADAVADIAQRVSNALSKLIEVEGKAPVKVAARLRQETIARLKAEGISDDTEAAAMADRLMGDSLTDYVCNIISELQSSNLIKVAESRLRGETQTQLGNDYAAFLQYVIWLGGSFVTTNPVLVKLAWEIDPELWNKQVEDLIATRYTPDQLRELLKGPQGELDAAIETINSMVTMAVVEENCRLLRDIFLVTEGREGYVSLQVNPKNHSDSKQMITEAKNLYAHLQERLGGVPNVVFKLPATAAGKCAAKELTSEGIGVTITVEFAVFQALGFGEVLNRGKMLTAYLALMNGRMAYPVRDEMKQKGVKGGVEAARWAGVEVARKVYRRLYEPPEKGGMGVDRERVKLLIASLRIYDDWIPDISELWGSPVMTIFPNVRRKFDSRQRDFSDKAVLKATPAKEMDILSKSEIFRQAWWVPADAERFKPKRVITLEPQDSDALAEWPPVANTLGQFIDLYQQMGEKVTERMECLSELTRA